MYVLGSSVSHDHKGAQLEQLARRLLQSLGHENIVPNEITNGGSEVDLSADFVIRGLGGDIRQRVICECKAHRNPINTSDWLKFLGKIFQDQLLAGHEVHGCMIALAGANGPVNGSYQQLPNRERNIRLITGDRLATLAASVFEAVDEARVAGSLTHMTERVHRGIELAYYDGDVNWIIAYAGAFTILSKRGEYLSPDNPRVRQMEPLVRSETEAGTFIDLRQEARAQRKRAFVRRLAICAAMKNGGTVNPSHAMGLLFEPQGVTQDELAAGFTENIDAGWMIHVDNERVTLNLVRPDDRIALFQFFLQDQTTTEAIGTPCWDGLIDDDLLNAACERQQALVLSPDERAAALTAMRLSPNALLYAFVPDAIICLHREQMAVLNERWDAFDRQRFVDQLYTRLQLDFAAPELARYFAATRGITVMTFGSRLSLGEPAAPQCEREIRQRVRLVELGEPEWARGRWVQVLDPDYGVKQ